MKHALAIFLLMAFLFAGCLGIGQAGKANEAGTAPADAAAVANKTPAQAVEKPAEAPMTEENRAVYLDYNPDEFWKSVAAKKVIFLEFYSPDSAACVQFEPQIYDAFAQMSADRKYINVIGFRVTMGEWEDIEKQYGVTAPDTQIILGRDGQLRIKETAEWDRQKLIDSIAQAV